MRVLTISLICLAACATEEDRPQTLAYITETILAPSCAQAPCHSSVRRQSGYAFDTVEHTKEAFDQDGLVVVCATPPCFPSDSYLITVLTEEDTFGNRMPLDQPLANRDIYFIGTWIEAGAPGYTPNVPPP